MSESARGRTRAPNAHVTSTGAMRRPRRPPATRRRRTASGSHEFPPLRLPNHTACVPRRGRARTQTKKATQHVTAAAPTRPEEQQRSFGQRRAPATSRDHVRGCPERQPPRAHTTPTASSARCKHNDSTTRAPLRTVLLLLLLLRRRRQGGGLLAPLFNSCGAILPASCSAGRSRYVKSDARSADVLLRRHLEVQFTVKRTHESASERTSSCGTPQRRGHSASLQQQRGQRVWERSITCVPPERPKPPHQAGGWRHLHPKCG